LIVINISRDVVTTQRRDNVRVFAPSRVSEP